MSASADGRSEKATESDRELLRQFLAQSCNERFLAMFGAHAVGVGRKLTNGRDAGSGLSVRLYVERKRHSGLGPLKTIPKTVEVTNPVTGQTRTFNTDVVETAPLRLQGGQDLSGGLARGAVSLKPPVRGGDSCSPADTNKGSLGTIGGFAWDSHDQEVVMISNRHVLGATRGCSIVSPGFGNNWNVAPTPIGVVKRASAPAADGSERVDCTIGRLFPGWPDTDVPRISKAIYAIEVAIEGLTVQMRTWTDSKTDGAEILQSMTDFAQIREGLVDDIGYSTWIIDVGTGKRRWICDCLRVIPSDPNGKWSVSGDSGSLVFSSAPLGDGSGIHPVVGLHFAGDPASGIGYACKIQSVFEEMELETIPTGAFRWFIEWMTDRGERLGTRPALHDVADLSDPNDLSFFTRQRRNEARARERYESLRAVKVGGAMNRMMSARAHLLSLLMNDRVVQRAVVNALGPMFTTEEDPLSRRLSAADVQRLGQLATVLIERDPANLEDAIRPIGAILQKADGRTLQDILKS